MNNKYLYVQYVTVAAPTGEMDSYISSYFLAEESSVEEYISNIEKALFEKHGENWENETDKKKYDPDIRYRAYDGDTSEHCLGPISSEHWFYDNVNCLGSISNEEIATLRRLQILE